MARVVKPRRPLAAAARLLVALVCAAVAVPSLASPAGWVYMVGEVLLAIAVTLLVAPAFRAAVDETRPR